MAATATVDTMDHTSIMVLARTTMTPTTILTTTLLLPIMGQASASRLGSKL
jgi:predicted membrane channel-forming protein YqfA (hemolysin III family)